MPIPEEARPWAPGRPGTATSWFYDVDVYTERVKAAGGQSPSPEEFPGVGRLQWFRRSAWAVFILFEGRAMRSACRRRRDARACRWHELHAGDLESALAFYSGLFGWTRRGDQYGADGCLPDIRQGGAPCGGMMTKTPETPAPFWLYYFNVEGGRGRRWHGMKECRRPDHPRPHAGSRRQLDRPCVLDRRAPSSRWSVPRADRRCGRAKPVSRRTAHACAFDLAFADCERRDQPEQQPYDNIMLDAPRFIQTCCVSISRSSIAVHYAYPSAPSKWRRYRRLAVLPFARMQCARESR